MSKNYIPSSMSFGGGFLGPRGDVGYLMEVDEEKAILIIEEQIEQGRNIECASLGLDGDWDCNNTEIYDSEGFHEYDSYFGSQWATPTLMIFYSDAPSESFECWRKTED